VTQVDTSVFVFLLNAKKEQMLASICVTMENQSPAACSFTERGNNVEDAREERKKHLVTHSTRHRRAVIVASITLVLRPRTGTRDDHKEIRSTEGIWTYSSRMLSTWKDLRKELVFSALPRSPSLLIDDRGVNATHAATLSTYDETEATLSSYHTL